MIRTSGDPAALAPSVRTAVQSIDSELPLFDLATLPAAFKRSNWSIRVFGALFFAFAVIALLMASVGIYAVVAQATARRTREIGIRMALGSTATAIIRLVFSSGLLQLASGVGLGLILAFAATDLMDKTGLLFRVSARDPWVFVVVPVFLAAVGVLAIWLPAYRASRVDPIRALRVD